MPGQDSAARRAPPARRGHRAAHGAASIRAANSSRSIRSRNFPRATVTAISACDRAPGPRTTMHVTGEQGEYIVRGAQPLGDARGDPSRAALRRRPYRLGYFDAALDPLMKSACEIHTFPVARITAPIAVTDAHHPVTECFATRSSISRGGHSSSASFAKNRFAKAIWRRGSSPGETIESAMAAGSGTEHESRDQRLGARSARRERCTEERISEARAAGAGVRAAHRLRSRRTISTRTYR